MASSLLDRLGLGNARAVANARRASLDRAEEDRLIAGLVEAITVHEARAAARDRSTRVAA